MRIALTALQQRHYLTGTGRHIAELFRELPLVAPQHEFLLYVKPNQVALFPPSAPNARLQVLEKCPASPLKRTAWEFVFFPGQLRRDKVDLFHGPANFIPLRKVCPYILTLHDMVYFHNPERTTRFRAAFWQWHLRRQWPLAERVLTVSEFSRQEIMKYLPVPAERIAVTYNGVEGRFFADPGPELRAAVRRECGVPGRYVLYVGRLDPDKNVARLLEAFAMVGADPEHADLVLVIAGAKDFQASALPTLAEKLGIAKRVRFAGYVKEEHLVAIYAEAAAFCYPSLNEGFGLPVAEAMATGTPVVASNVSSLPEVAGDGAIQVDPRSVEAMAAGLRDALGRRAEELREAGPRQARRFTWRKAAEQTLEAYEVVMKRGRESV